MIGARRAAALASTLCLAMGLAMRTANAQACPPAGVTQERLLTMRSQRFEMEEGLRPALALGLMDCLSARDPVLRDEIAASAISRWLRGKLLPGASVQRLGERGLALLTSATDSAGFTQSFAALTLSEIVRADRLDSALTPATLAAIADAAAIHMTAIRDYRGYDRRDGWRHDAAHSADLILQLGVHPRVPPATIERLLLALASQVPAHEAHVYLDAEPERMARTVALIHARGVLREAFWDNWMATLADPGPLGNWGAAFESSVGRARRQNILSFLHTLGLAARLARPANEGLAMLVDRELRRLISV